MRWSLQHEHSESLGIPRARATVSSTREAAQTGLSQACKQHHHNEIEQVVGRRASSRWRTSWQRHEMAPAPPPELTTTPDRYAADIAALIFACAMLGTVMVVRNWDRLSRLWQRHALNPWRRLPHGAGIVESASPIAPQRAAKASDGAPAPALQTRQQQRTATCKKNKKRAKVSASSSSQDGRDERPPRTCELQSVSVCLDACSTEPASRQCNGHGSAAGRSHGHCRSAAAPTPGSSRRGICWSQPIAQVSVYDRGGGNAVGSDAKVRGGKALRKPQSPYKRRRPRPAGYRFVPPTSPELAVYLPTPPSHLNVEDEDELDDELAAVLHQHHSPAGSAYHGASPFESSSGSPDDARRAGSRPRCNLQLAYIDLD